MGELLRGQRNCGRLTSAEILKWIGEPEGQRDEASVNLTFCVHCGAHYPVGKSGDFIWADTEIKVGT